MDFRSEASSWTIHYHDPAEDIIGVCFDTIHRLMVTHPRSITPQDSPASCAESSWERTPDARGLECVSLAL